MRERNTIVVVWLLFVIDQSERLSPPVSVAIVTVIFYCCRYVSVQLVAVEFKANLTDERARKSKEAVVEIKGVFHPHSGRQEGRNTGWKSFLMSFKVHKY